MRGCNSPSETVNCGKVWFIVFPCFLLKLSKESVCRKHLLNKYTSTLGKKNKRSSGRKKERLVRMFVRIRKDGSGILPRQLLGLGKVVPKARLSWINQTSVLLKGISVLCSFVLLMKRSPNSLRTLFKVIQKGQEGCWRPSEVLFQIDLS